MKQRNRKRFDAAFKARVALEALQEKETLARIAKRHGVHPVQVGQWKRQLLEQSQTVFEKDASRDGERRVEELLCKIGELTVERDFLSRGLPRSR